MKQKTIGKKIAAGALSLGIIVSMIGGVPAGAVNSYFSQPSSWAAAEMERAEETGLLMPVYFETDLQGSITRREFAVLAVTLAQKLGLSVDLDASNAPFADLNGVFGKKYVNAAWNLGLMNGVSSTRFDPFRPITRMEICTLLSRLVEKCDVTLPQNVSGVVERLNAGAEGVIPDWARQGVIDIVSAGLMQGDDNGKLSLSADTSREQAMALALRSLDLGQSTLDAKNYTQAEQEKIAQLRELRSTFGQAEQPYAKTPVTTAPYAQGTLNTAFLQDGLNAINYVRTVAGLDSVSLSAEKNDMAQAGALLLAVSEYGHYPRQPGDMLDELYKKGYGATSTSNIGYGHADLSDFTLDCADDSDQSNITRVGHRRWLLDPTLTTVGLGFVDRYSTTQVVDSSYAPWNGPDYVTWPSEGVFPMELFNQNLAWSCSLSPNQYVYNRESLTVTVTDSNGTSWTMQTSNQVDTTGDFALVESTHYGGAMAVIFRPEGLEYRVGAPLTVEISGLQLKSGGTDTITYTVKLFN